MTTEQRRAAVEAILAEDPHTSERTIAARLGCSQSSIHRDIARLRRDPAPNHGDSQPLPAQVRSVEAQSIIAALDAELAASGKAAGRDLVWSAAEADVIVMIAAEVDRRVELSAQYAECGNTNVKLKIATELRLTEGAIARLYRQVSSDVPQPMSVTSLKASRAAHSRWDRVRMAQENHSAT